MSRTVIPPAYRLMIISSRPPRRRGPLGHQPRGERAVAVPRDGQVHGAGLGTHRLRGRTRCGSSADTPDRIALLIAQVPGQLGLQPRSRTALISCWMNPSFPVELQLAGIDLVHQLIERAGGVQRSMLPAAAALRRKLLRQDITGFSHSPTMILQSMSDYISPHTKNPTPPVDRPPSATAPQASPAAKTNGGKEGRWPVTNAAPPAWQINLVRARLQPLDGHRSVGGEGKPAGPQEPPPPTWKEHNHARKDVPRALLGECRRREGRPLNDPQESVDNIIEIPSDSTCPLHPV